MRNFLQKKKNPSKAFEYCLKLLERKDYSEFEIRRKLEQHFDSGIEETITKLKERGLLSDERYAERLIDKYIKKRYGFYKIENELNKRGVLNKETKLLLSKKYSYELEKENALYFIDKKPKEKLIAYLIQKGFRPHIVQEVLALKD